MEGYADVPPDVMRLAFFAEPASVPFVIVLLRIRRNSL